MRTSGDKQVGRDARVETRFRSRGGIRATTVVAACVWRAGFRVVLTGRSRAGKGGQLVVSGILASMTGGPEPTHEPIAY